MTHVYESKMRRLKQTTPQVIETLRGIDAFEINGKLWFRLLDITQALFISKSTEKELCAKLRSSVHAHHWRESYYGHKSYPSTLIDMDVIEDIAIRYAFVAHADVMAALPRTGEKIEPPATHYERINWDMINARKARWEAKRSRKPGSGGAR